MTNGTDREDGVGNLKRWLEILRDCIRNRSVLDLTKYQTREQAGVSSFLAFPAEAISIVLKDELLSGADSLCIRGARIRGRLDLSNRTVECKLSIVESLFEESPLFVGADLVGLDLSGSTLPALEMFHTEVHGAVILNRLSCHSASIVASQMHSLEFADAKVATETSFDRSSVYRETNLIGTRFDGHVLANEFTTSSLVMSAVSITGYPTALDFRKLRVTKRMVLTGAVLKGDLRLTDSTIAHLDLSEATIHSSGQGPAIAMAGTHVSAVQVEGLACTGSSTLLDATATAAIAKPKSSILTQEFFGRLLRRGFGALPVLLVIGMCIYSLVLLPTGAKSDPIQDLQAALLTATVSGLVSCALLEVCKRLLRLRGLYQAVTFRRWLDMRLGNRRTGQKAYQDFVTLSGAEPAYQLWGVHQSPFDRRLSLLSLFDLPVEQFAAQLSDATEAALMEPKKYQGLYLAMAGREPADSEGRNDMPNEVGSRARRSVDQTQIMLADGWKRYLIGAATALSGGAAIVFAELYGSNLANPALTVFVSIFLGGLIAQFAKDVSSGTAAWRK